jgi:SAM-dependent methyltransferase
MDEERTLANNKKLDPNKKLENSERWSGRATLLILAGIFLELVALYAFTKEIAWSEKAMLSLANLLIGVGLVIEYRCIRKAQIAAAELQRLSNESVATAEALGAEANQRAAEANLALEKFRARRALSPEQIDRMAERLKQFPDTQFDFAISSNDPEILNLLHDIYTALKRAGWVVLSWDAPVNVITVTPFDVQVYVGFPVNNVLIGMYNGRTVDLDPAASSLSACLGESGIEARARLVPTAMGMNANANAIHILIGRKM